MRSMSDLAESSDEGEQRRKRIRQACLNCRRKKVRCGGEKPVCTFCSRLSQACIYAEDGRSRRRTSFTFTGSNEETTGLLLETMASKFASFDNRLSKIEDTLQRLEPLLTNLSALSSSLMVQPSPMAISQDIQQSHPATSTCTNDLVQPIQSAHLSQPKNAFPPTSTLLFALDVYFRYCHNQPYSLFHEPTFRQRLVSGELPDHLAWAFLSAARRYSSFPDLAIDAPDDVTYYAGKAWETLKLPWSGGSSDEEVVSAIQTIILIVNIEHPSGSCASAYMKLGFALRLALHAKLHMPPENNPTPIFREERKRTFWSLYLQDKLITLSRERFSILRDEECRIELPCSEEAFREGREESSPTLDQFTGDCLDQEAAEKCCPLALIVVMASSLNRVSEYALQANRYAQLGFPWSSNSAYASISSMLLQLEHCFGMNEDLKESLKEKCYVNGAVDQHLAGPFIYAKSLLHLAHCLLDHPFLIQQRLQQLKHKAPPIFLKSAWNRCRMHAKSLLELKDTKNHNVLLLTSFYGYCTMIAGTIHVLAMNDDDTAVREEGEENYASAMKFLNELSYYWKHAALMANRLKRFRQQCENRRADLNPCSERPGHSPGDLKVLWQSVDYALLSAPTRPGSPVDNDGSGGLEYLTSPSRLFDFADFADLGVFPEGVDVFGTLPFLENGAFFDGSGGHGNTDISQTISNS